MKGHSAPISTWGLRRGAIALGLGVAVFALVAASGRAALESASPGAVKPTNRALRPGCDEGNGGLTLPEGFCATVFADKVGLPRHPAIAPNGDVFIALMGRQTANAAGGVVALRDTNHDGHADIEKRFGPLGGTGIVYSGNYLYLDAMKAILRYPMAPGALEPSGPPDTIVSGLPERGHAARNFALDGKGNMYVNVGSNTNACQVEDRKLESKGIDPCVELETRAGIWKFSSTQTGQKFSAAARYATGIRNAVGLAWNATDNSLYSTQHGRDNFVQNWPKLYDETQSAENPAEEFLKISQGDDFGWPYCYYDIYVKKLILAPEFGGDGKAEGRCTTKKPPVVAFPGHWAPNALLFYTGTKFPARYRDGAFIAFHGSWNRAPKEQDGFRVVFVPATKGKYDGKYETFANGFAEGKPSEAPHRPTGLGTMPDGSLLITDDKGGRVYQVRYVGK